MVSFARALPLLLVSVACSGVAGPEAAAGPDSGTFTTDAAAYTAKASGSLLGNPIYSVTVVARFTNPGTSTIYLARCYPDSPTPIYGVALVGQTDSWGAAYNPAWACVGHDKQIAVRPGETRVDTLKLTGPNAFEGSTNKGFGVTAGRFKLTYGTQSCTGDGECPLRDESLNSSNEFTIRLPQ